MCCVQSLKLTFLLILVVSAVTIQAEINGASEGNVSVSLAGTLRRQLMFDNYDYLPDTDNDVQHNEQVDNDENDDYYNHYEQRTNDSDPYSGLPHASEPMHNYTDIFDNDKNDVPPDGVVNSIYVPRANPKDVPNPEPDVSKKDLLYYIDEQKLSPDLEKDPEGNKAVRDHGSDNHDSDVLGDYDDTLQTTTPKVTYKLIKAGGGAGGRRAGERRLVLERSERGLAVMPLDGRPPPQFRLPRARAQYMPRDVDSDLDP